jgi:hypothetical protein
MSNTLKALAVNTGTEEQVALRPLLTLEKQLMDTLELEWHVQQIRIRSNTTTPMKVRELVDGIASELASFIAMIRKRLEYLNKEQRDLLGMSSSSYWRLFPVDAIEPREQFESLLCGYAHYLKNTSGAMTSLRLAGDLESCVLLNIISEAVERTLWFLEIYFEGLALNPDGARLPEWSSELS